MLTRREWLKWTAAGALGALPGCGAAGGGQICRTGPLDRVAGCYGAKGWALWQGRSRVQAWNSGSRGPALSITKTIAGLAVVRAVQEGKVHLDERVAATCHEWASDPSKARITPRMLLQQVSGLEKGADALYRRTIADKGRTALALRAIDAPGTVFRYGPSHWEALGEFLHRKTGGLEHFLHRAVMRPVGLSSPKWRADLKGRFFLSTGTDLSVEDLGRLGRTLARLLRGEDADGFEASVFSNVMRPSAVNPMFGGGLWRNSRVNSPGAHVVEVEDSLDPVRSSSFWAGACLSRRHPADLVALVGSSGQRVFILPSKDRVFARLGRSPSWKDKPVLDALAD